MEIYIGHITAVGVGKATITAKAIHAEAKCEVEVIPIPVREIVLTPNNKELNVGETVQFSAAIAPEDAEDKSIVWSVETEGVVTIDEDGLVTAVGVGYAYIRATASNGVYARALVKVYGPVSVPFTEDFEDLDALYQWRVYNNDGDKHSWYYATESDHVSSHSGLHCLINYSYYGGDLTPDDWVVTPPVRLDAEYNQLGFWVWPYLTTWALEVYGAYIFTELSDEGPVNPTQLVKGTLTQGASEIYGSNSYVETVDGFEHVVVDIPEDFYGKTVYLAFRHFDCSGQYALLLDDVLVSNTPIEREAVEPEPSPAPKKPSLFRGDRAIPQNVRPFGHSIVK